MKRLLPPILSLLLLAADPADAGDADLRAGAFTPPRPAPAFSLRGSDGAPLDLDRYRGKVVVLAFGFTSCSSVCPVTLATLAQARRKLGADADDFQVVYVTVDPERDDAARMREYLAKFDPSFVGGTGSEEELAAVRNEYGILASKLETGSGYTVAHASYTYLIDREGRLRALVPYGSSADDYAHDLGILLQE